MPAPLWPRGLGGEADAASGPPLIVVPHGSGTFLLRQSIATHFEAPFLYLLVGAERALLLDTGAGGVPVRAVVDGLIGDRELVVVTSHAHSDHVGGDEQLRARPKTRFHGRALVDATLELGDRTVDVVAAPGHHPEHLVLHDRETGWLLTGDTIYPGRLYVTDFAAYTASIARLVALAERRPVSALLGSHVEMTTRPGEEIPVEAPVHQAERALELGPEDLDELHRALRSMEGRPRRETHDAFVIVPSSGPPSSWQPSSP